MVSLSPNVFFNLAKSLFEKFETYIPQEFKIITTRRENTKIYHNIGTRWEEGGKKRQGGAGGREEGGKDASRRRESPTFWLFQCGGLLQEGIMGKWGHVLPGIKPKTLHLFLHLFCTFSTSFLHSPTWVTCLSPIMCLGSPLVLNGSLCFLLRPFSHCPGALTAPSLLKGFIYLSPLSLWPS